MLKCSVLPLATPRTAKENHVRYGLSNGVPAPSFDVVTLNSLSSTCSTQAQLPPSKQASKMSEPKRVAPTCGSDIAVAAPTNCASASADELPHEGSNGF